MPRIMPRTKRWTRREYYQLVKKGFFDRQRVELVRGRLVQMPPMRNDHAVSISLTEDCVRAAFGTAFWVRIQMPLDLTNTSAPEPDLAVVPGRPRDYQDHPNTALLVIEVSESTLWYDRKIKVPLYADGRIQELWIVNLVNRQLEVFRDPQPDTTKPGKLRYTQTLVLQADEEISPLGAPQSVIKVADLLP